ncbi:hypothetical protein PCANC_05272 [Puccinia coronata f. sp. avenae]|uniref:Uncharacterized protein n=1 Tax=Puccinia coronata f. sp. avenae TaxID=200324 RepID=A0A2N5VYP7_9BASI|nr:hypothetical protein PCANC_05272 [Puccinia coronata f. sp. avenae]
MASLYTFSRPQGVCQSVTPPAPVGHKLAPSQAHIHASARYSSGGVRLLSRSQELFIDRTSRKILPPWHGSATYSLGLEHEWNHLFGLMDATLLKRVSEVWQFQAMWRFRLDIEVVFGNPFKETGLPALRRFVNPRQKI